VLGIFFRESFDWFLFFCVMDRLLFFFLG